MLETPNDFFSQVVNFGVAGLMGVLWTWERMMSRQRERQLTEAHDRMLYERSEVSVLTDLIERNTRAVIRFEETQSALRRLLEQALMEPRSFQRDILNPSRRPPHDVDDSLSDDA